MRADGFTPGFLARIVTRPRWLARLLRPISVGPILRGLGIHPLVDLHIRPYEEWIRERIAVEGDAPAGSVLTAEMLCDLAWAAHELVETVAVLPLSRLDKWRYYPVMRLQGGPEIFEPDERRQAERRLVANARRDLDDVARWLREDGTIYGSPEGRLSPDGRVSPMSGGFHRVLRAAPADTRVLPIAVVYDFMRSGRPRLFVDVAPAIEHAPGLARAELNASLRSAWLRSARFTCTQLATGAVVRRTRTMGTVGTMRLDVASPESVWPQYEPARTRQIARRVPAADASATSVSTPLVAAGHGGRPHTRKVVWQSPPFTSDELAREVTAQAVELAATGRHVDERLLHPRSARRLTARYLAYATRRGAVRRLGRDLWVPTPGSLTIKVRPGDVGYRQYPLAYAWNELQEMLAVDVRAAAEGSAQAAGE
jgi:hypothetical protein